jgi:hypothetical protein
VWEFIKSAVLSILSGRVEGGTEKLRLDVWQRAGRLCECTMKTCSHHGTRCNAALLGDWELHRIDPGGLYILSNVIAVCETCHRRNTPTAIPCQPGKAEEALSRLREIVGKLEQTVNEEKTRIGKVPEGE